MQIRRVMILSIALPACGASPTAPVAPVAQVDVAPPAAPPETRFRGYVTVDAVPLAGQSIDAERQRIEETARAATKELLPCLRHEAPKPTDVWIVGRVNEQGSVELARTEASVPAAVAACVTSVVGGIKFESAEPFALSMVLRGEPAPGDCRGEDCTLISLPDGNVHDDGPTDEDNQGPEGSALEHAANQGVLGVISADDVGVFGMGTLTATDATGGGNVTYGVGGLGLAGTGTGPGEGIGLGSIGTMGHGAGTGTGMGFGSGFGRLGGTHKGKIPSVRMGATTVSGRLPPEVVQRIVRQNFGRFRLCYEEGLKKDPTLEGSVNTTFIIGRKGDVTKVTDAKSDLKDAGVVQCVQKSFTHLSFPQPEGGIVSVMYPVHFEPGKEPPPPPVYAVAGEHFPVLAPQGVEKKLSSAGWRTMSMRGALPDAPFVVFAIKSGASMNPMERPMGFLTTALWEPATGVWRTTHRDSEGFRLSFEGDKPEALEHDLIDAEPVKPSDEAHPAAH